MTMWLDSLAVHLSAQIADLEYRPSSTGGNVYVERELPDEPALVVRLVSTGGPAAHENVNLDTPTFQLEVRSATVESGMNLWDLIYDELHGLAGLALANGSYIVLLRATQSGPLPLPPDGRGRLRWTTNYEAHVHHDAALYR